MSDEPAKKSDIDFDELDKAVNSLMGNVGSETLEDSDRTKTLAINTTLKGDEKPTYDALGKAAEAIGNETLVTDGEVELVEDLTKLPDVMELPDLTDKKPESEEAEKPKPTEQPVSISTVAPKPAVKRPSSGRFMDMVHPKGDMRGSAPLPNLVVPDRAGAKPAATPVVAATPVAVAKPEVKEETPPLEAPLTPFLPDAKVEKRPLGAAQPTGGNIPVSSDTKPTETVVEPVETPVTAAPIEPEESEPVETEPINSEPKKKDDGSGDEQRALNASDFEKETSAEQELSKIESSEAKTAAETPTIEKVESGDTEDLKAPKKMTYDEATTTTPKPAAESAIYDTKEYHQPISHPAKQKSGWSTVIIIVIIIVLMVAIAGGAYLLFIQH